MTSPPPLDGLHHLKLPVSDLARSRRWYESVLGLRVRKEFVDDDDGVLRGVAGVLSDRSGTPIISLALRQNPEVAAGMTGFDPLALSVATREALDVWADHVATLGGTRPRVAEHENVATLFLHDPDGLEIRLFGPAS